MIAQPVRASGTFQSRRAQVAKLVDALASGARVRKGVKVRVLSWAPNFFRADTRTRSLSRRRVTSREVELVRDPVRRTRRA